MEKHLRKKKTHVLPSKKRLNRRIFFISLCMIGCLGFLAYRVGSIKLIDGEEYQKTVLKRMVSGESEIAAQRGAIVDRNNKTLATSTLAYNVALSPRAILSLEEDEQTSIYKALSEKVEKTEAEIKKLVEANPTSLNTIVAKDLESEKAESLKELKGVYLQETFIRKYPKDELAAQVLGFYSKEGKGQYGIEQQYNQYLEGQPGRVFSQYQDEQFVTTEIQAAENGATVVLTLDEIIQQYVETTMKKYIKEYNPLNASAIIMNPNTGEIYSMFSYPSFNPNTYNNLSEQLGASTWKALSDQQKSTKLNEAWINRGLQYSYEPGSTFKPIFVAAALEEGVIHGDETYNCLGSKTVAAGTTISCWKAGGHGVQTLEEALANSCNVAMMEISEKIDSDTLLSYVKRYGFGQSTSIDLPGEVVGRLHSSLSVVDKAVYSMGQGLTVTPLQLINAFSAVINGGYLLDPYIVSEVIGENKETLYEHKKLVRNQVISTGVSKTVANYLKKVVEDGTGANAAISGYNIGGKTGTAEKQPRIEGKHVLSFMGYAPIINPQVVGLVVFDEIPEHSGVPTMVFKEIMENVLPYLEIELSGTGKGNGIEQSEVPNVVDKDLYEAISQLEQKGLDYELVGVGNKITSQYPKEGTTVSKGSSVKIYVQTDTPGNVQEVPNLVGFKLEEAKALVDGFFTVEGTGNGTIISQVPKAGSKIEKSSRIIVKTSE